MLHEINKNHGQFKNLRFVLRALDTDPGWGKDHLHCTREGWVDCSNGPALHSAEFDIPLGAYRVVKNTASVVILMDSEASIQFPDWRKHDTFGWKQYMAGTYDDLDTHFLPYDRTASVLKQINDIVHPHYFNPKVVELATEGMIGYAKTDDYSVCLYGAGRIAAVTSIRRSASQEWLHTRG